MAMRLPASASAITSYCLPDGRDAVDASDDVPVTEPTRERILRAATDLFGTRGVEGVSLDAIAAEVGVRKQTLLYWFPSRDELLSAVLASVAAELHVLIEAAVRAAPDEPLAKVDAVVTAVFRPAVRRPALLGLVREVNRLPPAQSAWLRETMAPLADRATAWLAKEMAAGRVRGTDARLVIALAVATVTGIATEPDLLSVTGWRPTISELRSLRDELRSFLHGALAP
jgi:AcrR family transcriptional regulator